MKTFDTGGARCPRCGVQFHCGAGDDTPCACTGVVVPVAVQASLRQRYTGCLCLACLQAVAQGAAPALQASEEPATTGGQAASLR